MSYYRSFYWMNRGMVGKLQVKNTEHWRGVDDEYWKTCGINNHIRTEGRWWERRRVDPYTIHRGMVDLQHKLVDAAECEDNDMILVGSLYRWTQDPRFMVPYHPDLFKNWGKFWYAKSASSLHFYINPCLQIQYLLYRGVC